MPERKARVFACIASSRRPPLLAHPGHPDAGIMVPSGTLKPGEDAIAGPDAFIPALPAVVASKVVGQQAVNGLEERSGCPGSL